MKTLILTVLMLSGCTTMTSKDFGDLMLRALAARVASGSGYNNQQAMRDGQNYINAAQDRADRQYQQMLNNDFIFGKGGYMNPYNVRIYGLQK